MKKFFGGAGFLILAVIGFGMTNQLVNDRTMENCTVYTASNLFNTPAQSSLTTSCGYVYINSHIKNGFINPDAITKMNEAVHSGKPVNIKATGFIASAYEITVSK